MQNLFFRMYYRVNDDISNAFYHTDIAPESKKYVGFEWLGKFYHYNSSPMGIHSSQFIFYRGHKTYGSSMEG